MHLTLNRLAVLAVCLQHRFQGAAVSHIVKTVVRKSEEGRIKMPKLVIEAQCDVNGVGSVGFPDDYGFHLMLRCSHCGEETEKPAVVSTSDEVTGIRGATVSLRISCKLCDRKNDLKILGVFPYETQPQGWKKILELECRGMEPTKLILSDGSLIIKGTSGFEFEDAVITDREFYGYDEKEKTDVSLTDWETRVVKPS